MNREKYIKQCCHDVFIAAFSEVIFFIKQNNIQTIDELLRTLYFAIDGLEKIDTKDLDSLNRNDKLRVKKKPD